MKETIKEVKVDIEDYENIKTNFEAYTGSEPYLFVSYSHRDTAKVYPILDALNEKKYRIWYDESCETGNDFRQELRERIENSNGVLLFVSKDAMNSPFCGMEILVACEEGKKIYPIYLDTEEVPPAFQIYLSYTHHSTADNMEKLIKNMLRDLPAETMNRLTIENDILENCEDNGERIKVDEGVVKIKEGAFKNKRALKYIELPESLTEIEFEGFRGCTNLREMETPQETQIIGESAFRDCTNLKRLKIRNNCIKINERAFENCAELVDVQLPEELSEIYGGVFNSCKSLEHIKLPDKKLTIIGESAFSDCIVLEDIDVPTTVTKIDDLAFNGCIKMGKVELKEGLKKIGKSAFKNCKSLTKVVLPATVTNISDAPFRGCEALKSIRVESKNKYFKSEPNRRDGNDHVLFNKNKSILIAYPASSIEVQYDIPDSVTIISDWAFNECKKLNRITIPDSVNEIGEGAFSNCRLLDRVEIPDSVTIIDDCAFRGCSSLEKIVIPSSVKELGWGVFDSCCKELIVYCDEGSVVQKYCKDNGITEVRISEKDND